MLLLAKTHEDISKIYSTTEMDALSLHARTIKVHYPCYCIGTHATCIHLHANDETIKLRFVIAQLYVEAYAQALLDL
jgi:uncharacterized CHY-type Zn-finger protein